ncbi:hypothetical protein O181_016313 [Austropuccinia psidii MF-1]|uniref:Uncharacterized protein n=1 Tax=Austropuccinia psidii MF-1 TaxID=1389203 RepID=A0A9Q3C436_9BASI|nr:hypothetical protein [Austropuccinia psidii MF-1]
MGQDLERAVCQTGEKFYVEVSEHLNGVSKVYYCDSESIHLQWLAMKTEMHKLSEINNKRSRNPPGGSSPSD